MPHSSLAHWSSSCFAGGGADAVVRRWHARISSARARTKRCISSAIVAAAVDGPSCLFVGSIETASQEMLEALYEQINTTWAVVGAYFPVSQGMVVSKTYDDSLRCFRGCLAMPARDSYYSGKPLVFDDMFDKVELKLRLYGSKSVVKYPRCSLMRQSTYADAEEDPSQVLALATVWILLLALGSSAFLIPTILTISIALEDAFSSRSFLSSNKYSSYLVPMLNSALFAGLGVTIGYPIASSSSKLY